jgi:hypothetical protein
MLSKKNSSISANGDGGDTAIWKSLADSIDRMSRESLKRSPFPTYTNGERRSEEKNLNRALQQSVSASVARALNERD